MTTKQNLYVHVAALVESCFNAQDSNSARRIGMAAAELKGMLACDPDSVISTDPDRCWVWECENHEKEMRSVIQWLELAIYHFQNPHKNQMLYLLTELHLSLDPNYEH